MGHISSQPNHLQYVSLNIQPNKPAATLLTATYDGRARTCRRVNLEFKCLLVEFLRPRQYSEGFIFGSAVNTSMPLSKLSSTEHSSRKSASSPVSRDVEEAIAPSHIRVSSGSAVVLGLIGGRLDAEPTTAYLLTSSGGKCTANCGFCSQARGSRSRQDLLSRVVWPVFSTGDVVDKLASSADKGHINLQMSCYG